MSISHKASANLSMVEREIGKDGEYNHENLFYSFQPFPHRFFSDRDEHGNDPISAD